MSPILNEILESADPAYKEFHKKLIPTIDENTVLGLRSPNAQAIAKKYAGTEEGEAFLSSLPHAYYDENLVHAFMLGNLRLPRGELREKIDEFLPYVDNWAVCDGLSSHLKYFFKDKALSYDFVLSCVCSDVTYTVRFGLVCLLNYYITDEYIDKLASIIEAVQSDEYYINMAIAWLVSFMLIKQYEKTVPLLIEDKLDTWVHNKAIQKACESYRIADEQKKFLKNLRRRNESKYKEAE